MVWLIRVPYFATNKKKRLAIHSEISRKKSPWVCSSYKYFHELMKAKEVFGGKCIEYEKNDDNNKQRTLSLDEFLKKFLITLKWNLKKFQILIKIIIYYLQKVYLKK